MVDQPNRPNPVEIEPTPCCPDLAENPGSTVLDYHYRLRYPTSVTHNNQRVEVELLIHARFERRPGPLALGKLVYSTTLFPGEKVRLFTMNRRTRFTYDSSSELSYRNEQVSEEQFYTASLNDFMSDLTVRDEQSASSHSQGEASGRTSASGVLDTIFGGPSVSANGSYNASSTSDFMRELHQHAESSHRRSEEGVRTAESISMGEVNTRNHAEGETEDHFESASRVFANPNRCHALTFLFYQLNRTQTVRFSIESIQRRVIDPAGETSVVNNRFRDSGGVEVIPNGVLATDRERLQVEAIGREAARRDISDEPRDLRTAYDTAVATRRLVINRPVVEPMPDAVRAEALREVDEQLGEVGLIERESGAISPDVQSRYSFEQESSLPTAGVLVKGCLDDCNICEEALREEIQLDLQRKRLENQMLRRQIELLEQSQQYRCCPDDDEDDD